MLSRRVQHERGAASGPIGYEGMGTGAENNNQLVAEVIRGTPQECPCNACMALTCGHLAGLTRRGGCSAQRPLPMLPVHQ